MRVEYSRDQLFLAAGKPKWECVMASTYLFTDKCFLVNIYSTFLHLNTVEKMNQHCSGTFLYKFIRFGSLKGKLPESISYKITPQDHISAADPSYLLLSTNCHFNNKY